MKLLFSLVLLAASVLSAAEQRPNIVLILTDNHGAWTLGCYGNEDVRTPHLDQLATEGALFTRAYSVNPVCSPTRASILTGLMPSQHGIQFPVGNSLMMGPEARNTLEEFTSLPEVLKANGYTCGLSGKWHLGANMSPQEGLDDLWVTMPVGSTQRFYGAEIIENGVLRTEPQYMTELWTDRAVDFIKTHASKPTHQKPENSKRQNTEKPFFLYLAYNGPYGLSPLLLEPARNRHAEYYANHSLPSFPRVPTRPWQFSNRDYVNNMKAFRRYAAEVSGVDDGVGRIVAALEEAGVADNTILIFTGDQGSGAGQHNLWGMGDHTRPLHGFDTTMHVPLIMRYPDSIKPDTKVKRLVSQVDLFPTVLELAGLSEDLPTENPLPGRDLTALLSGNDKTAEADDAVFFEFENLRSIRTADWKLIERYDDNGQVEAHLAHDELYDLANDPGETVNLYQDPAHKETRNQLMTRLMAFFAIHNLPKYDVWNGGTAQTRNHIMGEYARTRHESRIALGFPQNPFDPDFNPPPMTIPDDTVVETAAAPPLVNHPVAGCLDDRGRLFLCENTGDNFVAKDLEERLQNVVTLLTDTNGDGNYDQRQVFADGFTFPQGVLWHDGALYVASPPSIWKLTDDDDDGVADTRVAIASGFGYTGNAATVHTPRISPTGRLFWGHGRKPSQVKDVTGKLVHTGASARIWTSTLEGHDLRPWCGGGMANPVELDFWPTGEVIGNVNILHRDPVRRDSLVHWQDGGTYPRHENLVGIAEFTTTGPLLQEFHDFGHVAVAGLTMYHTDTLSPPGEDWTNNIFMTEFNNQELVRLAIKRDGASFTAREYPFLKIHDPDVHLVGVLEDADGSLLLIDTGGWFRQGCPSSGIAKPDVPGAVYRIRKAGPWQPLADHRGNSIEWDKAAPGHLAALLDDTRHVVRDRATNALVRQKTESTAVLVKTLKTHPNSVVRVRAAFALCRIGNTAAASALRLALKDRDIDVRLAATQSLAELGDKAALRYLLLNLNHDSLALQRETATAMGRLGDPLAIAPILTTLSNPELDRQREHALLWALLQINDPAATREALTSIAPLYPRNPDFTRRVLLALDRLDPEALTTSEVTPHLGSRDEALRHLATELLSNRLDQPAWASCAADTLERIAKNPQDHQLDVARALLGKGLAEDEATRQHFTTYLTNKNSKLRDLALDALAASPGTKPHDAWIAPLQKLLDPSNLQLTEHALRAAASLDPQALNAEARALADNADLPRLLRIEALRLFDSKGKALGPIAFDLIESILADADAWPSERLEAARLLVASGITRDQMLRSAKFLAVAGPLEFPLLHNRIRRPKDVEIGKALAYAYVHAPGAVTVTARELLHRSLKAYFPEEVWKDAEAPLNDRIALEENATNQLIDLEAKLGVGKGDVTRGQEVFGSAQAMCSICHKIGDLGNHVGPDLSAIGGIRKHRDLLESILFPSASFAQDYEGFVLTKNNGEVLSGVLASESTDTVELRLATGQSTTIPRSQIKSLSPLPVSLMPQGLGQVLTEQQLIDLVAYLATLK